MEKKHPKDRAAQVGGARKDAKKGRAAYQPPRIVKKRAGMPGGARGADTGDLHPGSGV